MHHHIPASILLLLTAALPAQNLGLTLVNGVDGYAEIPYVPEVLPRSGITVEAWITYDDTTLPTGWRYPTVVRQNLAAQTESYFLRIEAGNTGARALRWKVVTSATSSVACSWTFASGQLLAWTHVAATYDGAFARLFVNGAQVAQATGTGAPIIDRGDVLRIGKGSDIGGPIEVWNGQLDEVRLWPFARTAAEIAATMNMELVSVPGRVSTWNLNGGFADSSGSLHATGSGSIPFTANTLSLAALPFVPALPFGASTPGCGQLDITFGSMPKVGNLEFAPVCTRTQPNAAGFLLASLQGLGQPIAVAGVNLWLDPTTLASAFATVDGLGAARFRMAIPAFVAAGTTLHFQYGFIDPCGPAGVTASNAVTAIVLP